MTAGLRFVVCLQEAGWNLARRIQQAVFLPLVTFFFFKDPAKYVTSHFNPGWTVYMHFSAFFNPASQPRLRFQPGLSCKRAMAFMCVPGWNSSCKHSLSESKMKQRARRWMLQHNQVACFKMAAPPELRPHELGVRTQGGSSKGIPVPF